MSKNESESRPNTPIEKLAQADEPVIHCILAEWIHMLSFRLSHELRGPLARLKGLLILLSQTENPYKIKKYLTLALQVIEEQDRVISSLVRDLNKDEQNHIK